MRDFDSTQDHLLHPDGTAAQQRVTLPGAQEGALLYPGGREEKTKRRIGRRNLFDLCSDIKMEKKLSNVGFFRMIYECF